MNEKGQNIMEYILVVVALGLICIFFFSRQGPMRKSVEKSLNSTVLQIDHLSSQIIINENR